MSPQASERRLQGQVALPTGGGGEIGAAIARRFLAEGAAVMLGDLVPEKAEARQPASAFFGTPLAAHLTQLRIDTVIIVGESTSGCVRATAVDGYSHGFHVVLAEDCCFDRSDISHRVNLFDLHHKYADVMRTERIVAELSARDNGGTRP